MTSKYNELHANTNYDLWSDRSRQDSILGGQTIIDANNQSATNSFV